MAPASDTNFTLISSQHGWRLSRAFDATGARVLEWRCPRCWTARRKKQA